MSFQAPLFLLALGVVPLLLLAAAWARRRGRRFVVRHPAVTTLAAVAAVAPLWRRILPSALLCLALAGLALALARPEATVAVPVERASVMLVFDTSGSMRAADVEPNRLVAARAAGERFLDEVPAELQVGLVGYADAAHTTVAPTKQRDEVRTTLAGLSADGGTATGDALAAAIDALGTRDGDEDERPPAAVVLLSDGATTSGRDPIAVAREAGAAKVPVYTVALGTASGTIERPDGTSQSVPPDPQALRDIASASGGQAFATSDAGELDTVYERLGSQIGTREERKEISVGFAAGGLVLLIGAVAASRRWWGRLP